MVWVRPTCVTRKTNLGVAARCRRMASAKKNGEMCQGRTCQGRCCMAQAAGSGEVISCEGAVREGGTQDLASCNTRSPAMAVGSGGCAAVPRRMHSPGCTCWPDALPNTRMASFRQPLDCSCVRGVQQCPDVISKLWGSDDAAMDQLDADHYVIPQQHERACATKRCKARPAGHTWRTPAAWFPLGD